MSLPTKPTAHTSRQHAVAKLTRLSRSAANVLPAPEPPLEPGTLTAPGSTSTHASTLAQHPVHVKTHAVQDIQLLARISAPTRPTTLSSCHPLARPSVATHAATCHHAWSAIADQADACQQRNERQSEKAQHPKLWRAGIISGRCGEAVASRAGQSGAGQQWRRAVMCAGGVSIPAGAQKSVRASRSLQILAARAPRH